MQTATNMIKTLSNGEVSKNGWSVKQKWFFQTYGLDPDRYSDKLEGLYKSHHAQKGFIAKAEAVKGLRWNRPIKI